MKIHQSSLYLLIFIMSFCPPIFAQLTLNQIPEINQARVIAIGESAHGVKEFYNFKVDAFKELVELGITKTFMIENNYSGAFLINEYIHQRNAFDVDSLMQKGLYSVWRGPELAELIGWMRDYNSTKPVKERLSFLGIDAQSAKMAIEYVTTYLQTISPSFEEELPKEGMKLVGEMGGKNDYNIKRLSDEQQQSLVQTVERLRQLVEQAESPSPVHFHMKVIEQSLAFEQANPFNFTNIRDAHMAEMVMELMALKEHEDQAVFIWGHNGHISKSKRSFYKPLGYHLSNRLKEKYLVIGLDFFEGEIRNTYRTGTTVYEPVSDKRWVGHFIQDTIQDLYLLKMAEMPKVKIRDIGSGSGTLKTKRDRTFDYLFYFMNVNPSPRP